MAAKYEERFRDELQGKARDRELLAASAAGFDIIRAERREPYPSEGQTVRLYVEGQRRAASPHAGAG